MNKNSKMGSKLLEFCQKNISKTEAVGSDNYLEMIRDGSMALLRALTISKDMHYDSDLLDNTSLIFKDEEVDYYHLVLMSESMEINHKKKIIEDINDVHRVIRKNAAFFKTHFIKVNNDNKKDKILTDEIQSMILALNTDGYKFIAKDSSEIYQKIQNAVNIFNSMRDTQNTNDSRASVLTESREEVEMTIQGNNRMDQREHLLDNSTS